MIMNFTLKGYIELAMRFEKIGQVSIVSDDGVKFCWPSEILDDNKQPFTISLKATNIEEAEEKAKKILNKIILLTPLTFNAPVYDYKISRIESAKEAKAALSSSIDALLCAWPSGDSISFLSDFLVQKSSIIDNFIVPLSFYKQAIDNKNVIVRYWSLYLAMLQLFMIREKADPYYKEKSERNYINSTLLAASPTMPTIINTYPKIQEWTKFIAVRDSFCHEANNFVSTEGEAINFDTAQELNENINYFCEAVKKSLINKMINYS